MNQELAVAPAANLIDGKYSIRDVVDLPRLRSLLEKFGQLTGCTVALVSYPDQEILVSAGWRDVCTEFHRANPESAAVCLKSNISMTSKASVPGVVVVEPCDHGLVDGGVPIIINGVRLATLATGQAFFQPPDLERFRQQARRFGYDTEKYLTAVREVPVVSEERFRATLSLLGDLAGFIAQMGYYGLETRDRADALAGKFRVANLPQENPEVIVSIARDGRIIYANPAADAILGQPRIKPVILAKLCREALASGLNREVEVEIEGTTYSFLVVPTADYVSMYGREVVPRQPAAAVESMPAEAGPREGREDLEILVRSIRDVIWTMTGDGKRFLYLSPAIEEMFGRPQSEFFANAELWSQMIHPEDQAVAQGAMRQVFQSGHAEVAYRIVRPDGQVRWLRNKISVVFGDNGQPMRIGGIARDITETRLGQLALQDSEARYRALFDGMTEGFAIHEIITDDAGRPVDYRFLDVNSAFERLTGLKRQDVVGRTHNQVLPGNDPKWVQMYGQVALTGEAMRFENYARPLERHFEVFAYRPAPRQFATIFMDVSERKLADEAVRESQRRLTELTQNVNGGLWEATVTGLPGWDDPAVTEPYDHDIFTWELTFVNGEAFRQMLDLAEVPGQKWENTFFRSRIHGMSHVNRASRLALQGGLPGYQNEFACRNRYGQLKHLREVVTIHPVAPGKWRLYGVIMDVTANKLAEDKLRESETLLQEAQVTAGMGAYSLDVASGVWRSTQTLDNVFGIEPGYERTVGGWLALIHPDDQAMMAEYFRSEVLGRGQPFDKEYRIIRRHDHAARWVHGKGQLECDAQGRPQRMFGMILDITERKQKELEVERLNRTLKALSNCNAAMLHAEDEAGFLAEVCRIIVHDCGHTMAWIGYAEQDAAKTVRCMASAGFVDGYLDSLRISWGDNEYGHGPTGTAIRTGREYICRNMQTDPNFAPWRERAAKRGYACVVVVPLNSQGQVYGALNIYSREIDPFSVDEVNLLHELANALVLGTIAIRARQAEARSQTLLQQSEQRYRLLFDASPDGIVLVDKDGLISGANQAMIRMYGYDTLEEIVGMSPTLLAAPGSRAEGSATMQRRLAGENAPIAEYQALRKDGTIFFVEVSGAVVGSPDGAVLGYIAVNRDVTARKQVEATLRESRAQLDAALASMTDAVFISDAQGHFLHFNHAFATFHRFASTEQCSRNLAQWPDIIEVFAANGEPAPLEQWAVPRALRGESASSVEYILRRKDTGETWVGSYSFGPIHDKDGAIVGSVVVARDVTEQKRAEVQTSLYLAVIKSADNGIVITAADATIQWVNPAFTRLTGYSMAEAIGLNPRVLKSGVHDDAFYKNLWDTITGGQAWHGELVNRRKDGSLYNEEMTITPVSNAAGKVEHFVAIKQDITARKQAEDALRQSQQRLNEFIHGVNTGLWEATVTGLPGWDDPTVTEPYARPIFKWKTNLINMEGFRRLVDFPAQTDQAWMEEVRKARLPDQTKYDRNSRLALQGGLPGYQQEFSCRDRLGQVKHLHEVVSIHPLGPGQWRLYGVVTDITQRKQAEDALRQSQDRLTEFAQGVNSGLWEATVIGKPGWDDPALTEPHQHAVFQWEFNLINPEGFRRLVDLPQSPGQSWLAALFAARQADKTRLNRISTQAIRDGQSGFQLEYSCIDRQGQRKHLHEVASIHPLSPGRWRLYGVVTDITERKRIDEVLHESEERLRFALEGMHAGEWDLDLASLVIQRSLSHDRLFGYETLQPQWNYAAFLEHLVPEDREFVDREFQRKLATGEDWNIEYRIRRPDQTVRWMWARAKFQGDADGKPRRLVGIILDITERKRIEDALRDSELRYRTLFESMDEGFALCEMIYDQAGQAIDFRYLDVNPAFEKLTGLSAERVLGKCATEVIPGIEPFWIEHYAQVVRTGQGQRLANLVAVLGRQFEVYAYRPVPGHFAAIFNDITERKRIQDALTESEARFRAIFDKAAEGILLTHPITRRFNSGNSQICQMLGYTADEIGQLGLADIHPAAALPEILARFDQRLHSAQPQGKDVPVERKDGSVFYADINAFPLTLSGQTYIVGFFRDVSARKATEDALKESEARFRAIFEKAADGILVTEPTSLKFHSGNARIGQMLGYTPEEISQLGVRDIHPAENMPHLIRRFGQQWRGENTLRKDVAVTRKDGTMFYADINSFPMTLHGRTYLVDFFRDVSERKRSEDETKWYQKRLRALALELSLAEEQERKRLATNLHDDLSQVLTAIKMRIDLLQQSGPEEQRQGELKRIAEIADMAIQSSRSLTLSLSHPALYDLGLVAGAEWLAEDLQNRYQLKVKVVATKPVAIDLRVRVLLFQCLRELLVNVAKHAKTDTALVRISRRGRVVRVIVRDHGVGFVPSSLSSRSKHAGFGLFSIRERLRNLGGQIDFRSAPGKGTTVMLTVPDVVGKEDAQ